MSTKLYVIFFIVTVWTRRSSSRGIKLVDCTQ